MQLNRLVSGASLFGFLSILSFWYMAEENDAKEMIPIRVLLTGGTGAIGKAIAKEIAATGATVHLTARNEEKGKKTIRSLKRATKNDNIHLELVDLTSKKEILNFTKLFKEKYPKLDVLINNAAIVPSTGKKEMSEDGIEMQFAVNVYSYFLLMRELRETLTAASHSRIVNVASNYAGGLELDDLHYERRGYSANSAYMQSKQADRMLSWAAAEKFRSDGISVFSCHPGVVTSNVGKGLGIRSGWDSPADGAATPVHLALHPGLEKESGTYWSSRAKKSCPWRKDMDACNALWDYCDEL